MVQTFSTILLFWCCCFKLSDNFSFSGAYQLNSNKLTFIRATQLLARFQPIPSYIDMNAALEDGETLNSGLGKEEILYIDDHLIAVNKPFNLQTAPGYMDNTSLATVLAERFNIPRVDHMVAHRLDYGTSGVLVFARHIDALKGLQAQFRKSGSIYKRYTAIVNGSFDSCEGEINLPLGKDLVKGPPLNCVDVENGKPSLTYWRLVKRGRYKSQVDLRLQTGRTHQLRVHLSSIGHPILGDFFYSPPEIFTASNRLMLHAEELRIRHPITNQDMKIFAPSKFKFEKFDIPD